MRDLLLGRAPKDFDVATNAHPEQIRQVFRNCRLVGRRFLLAHIHFGSEIVEVATFRAGHTPGSSGGVMEDGRIVRDNVYGTLEQDAWRRDFTVNALYYNIRDFSLLDFCEGLTDLRAGHLRIIGEPYSRYREDPVRMLRVVRFAAKLDFQITPETEAPLAELAGLLREIPGARLFEEVLKLFLGGKGRATFELLHHYGLFTQLFPHIGSSLTLLRNALLSTDQRLQENQSVTSAFLFAALLWEPVLRTVRRYQQRGMNLHEALNCAAEDILYIQSQRVAIPRRYMLPIREIWSLQGRMANLRGKRHLTLAQHPRFRAAYDLLQLRATSGEVDVQELAEQWREIHREIGAHRENSHPHSKMPAAPADSDDDQPPPRRRRRKKKISD